MLRDDSHVYTFDMITGVMKDTGILGSGPLVYSADGKYFALSTRSSGLQLQIVELATLKGNTIGDFYDIGAIRASADGMFRVTAEIRVARDRDATCAFVCSPRALTLEPIWQSIDNSREYREMDFDPETMTGITTDFRLVTRIADLHDSTTTLTIDNSASYVASFEASRARRRADNTRFLISFFLIVIICISTVAVLIVRMLRTQSATKKRAPGAKYVRQ